VTGFDDVRALVAHLPEVTTSTSYGTPSLKVHGKSFCRMWGGREYDRYDVSDTEVLVVFCELEEKELLLEAGDGVLFSTPHYDGHGAVLVRLSDVDHDDLKGYLEESYLLKAPPRPASSPGRALRGAPAHANYEAGPTTVTRVPIGASGHTLAASEIFISTQPLLWGEP